MLLNIPLINLIPKQRSLMKHFPNMINFLEKDQAWVNLKVILRVSMDLLVGVGHASREAYILE